MDGRDCLRAKKFQSGLTIILPDLVEWEISTIPCERDQQLSWFFSIKLQFLLRDLVENHIGRRIHIIHVLEINGS